jgi:hypothetical protein
MLPLYPQRAQQSSDQPCELNAAAMIEMLYSKYVRECAADHDDDDDDASWETELMQPECDKTNCRATDRAELYEFPGCRFCSVIATDVPTSKSNFVLGAAGVMEIIEKRFTGKVKYDIMSLVKRDLSDAAACGFRAPPPRR